jgi:bla regulator protein BlaR1
MITHYLKSKNENISEVSQNYLHTKNILNDLLIRNNYRLTIIDDEDYIVYSKTNKMNNIYISKGVIETLNHEELKGIILHEIAHLERNKKNYIFILYILRIISFFNPIILYEFRRLLQEEEMVCDFLSAEKLQNKKTLARALFKLYIKERINQVKEANFKEYTAYYAIRKRIKALWANRIENSNYYALLITATILIIIINYFIV